MSEPVTLEQWNAALAAVVGDFRHEDVLPPPGQGTETVTVRKHATDPGKRWAAPRGHVYGAVPALLDAVPTGASTRQDHHTLPASQASAEALKALATHAVVVARQAQAKALVAVAPVEQNGALVLAVTLVMSPLPVVESKPA